MGQSGVDALENSDLIIKIKRERRRTSLRYNIVLTFYYESAVGVQISAPKT